MNYSRVLWIEGNKSYIRVSGAFGLHVWENMHLVLNKRNILSRTILTINVLLLRHP